MLKSSLDITNYNDAQQIFSSARMRKYLYACNKDPQRTMQLYAYNTHLAQAFFGVISIFEVVLRNAINEHYLQKLGADWIINQAVPNGLLEKDVDEILQTKQMYDKNGVYSHDKMIGSFTFGFWTYLFTKHNYKVGGKTLLEIFPKRAKGTTQKSVYRDITAIREFRNRIAHHEPICFDANGAICTGYMHRHYDLIKTYLQYMGIEDSQLGALVMQPDEWIQRVEELKTGI